MKPLPVAQWRRGAGARTRHGVRVGACDPRAYYFDVPAWLERGLGAAAGWERGLMLAAMWIRELYPSEEWAYYSENYEVVSAWERDLKRTYGDVEWLFKWLEARC